MSQPDSGEMALDIVDQLVRSSAVDVIVVDSVAALVRYLIYFMPDLFYCKLLMISIFVQLI